ncbi:MAG: FHA domain-containing protein [Alphaproteobacteria bacterium]|nr:FHA domain-containing protein [Alphaproteobacteria bacterium]
MTPVCWSAIGQDRNGRKWHFAFGPLDFARAGDGLVLGRNPDLCDLVLDDDSVSRRHLRLFIRDGRLTAEDMQSTNGTFLGDTKLAAHAPTEIRDGDLLRLGSVGLRIRYERPNSTAE